MYEDANEQYLKSFFENNILKSHLPHLVHQADLMATRIEYEQWKYKYRDGIGINTKPTPQKKYTTKKNLIDVSAKSDTSLVDKFYEDDKTTDEDLSGVNFDTLFVDAKKEK